MDSYKQLSEDGLRILFGEVLKNGYTAGSITPGNMHDIIKIMRVMFQTLLALDLYQVQQLNEGAKDKAYVDHMKVMFFDPPYAELEPYRKV